MSTRTDLAPLVHQADLHGSRWTWTTPAPSAARLIDQWGRSPVSPFLAEAGNVQVLLPDGGAAGYRPVGRWAVFPTEPAAPPGMERETVDRLLSHVATAGQRPVFAAVGDPEPYLARGMFAIPIADDAHLDLASLSFAGKRMANIRHSVTSARRAGLRIVPYSTPLAPAVEQVSSQWLAGKRGGELGFTLGRFDASTIERHDCRVALDAADRVVGFVTWRRYDDGHGRVLDLMRRADDSPNPTMDLLVAESLLEFAAAGVEAASLGAVPHSHGRIGERVYPTVSLRRYKDKFAPTWTPLWLITPSRLALPGAVRAVIRAYCPGGMVGALRRNG